MAILSAVSTASGPELTKKTWSRSPGASAAFGSTNALPFWLSDPVDSLETCPRPLGNLWGKLIATVTADMPDKIDFAFDPWLPDEGTQAEQLAVPSLSQPFYNTVLDVRATVSAKDTELIFSTNGNWLAALMALLDRQYLKTPFYGSRRMTAWLRAWGYRINRKRDM